MRVEDVGKVTIDTFKSGQMKLGSQTGTTNADLGMKLVGRNNMALYDAFSVQPWWHYRMATWVE